MGMTRIVSYNILAGGFDMRYGGVRRSAQLIQMVRPVQPDIIAVVEALHPMIKLSPTVLEEMAENLKMQAITGGDTSRCEYYQLALLTRLPIVKQVIHERPGLLARPLLEVCVEEETGEHLTVFVTHLSAAFNRGRGGGGIRQREIKEILRITAPHRAKGIPHLIMGDFNSMAPGDAFAASALLRYVTGLDKTAVSNETLYDGLPNLRSVVPPQLRFLNPLLKLMAGSDVLCRCLDALASVYAPRDCIRDLKRFYVDAYRNLHPHDSGFTCPAASPSGRIDYIFASPLLAERLIDCEVLRVGEDGLPGYQASDHFPITASFAPSLNAKVSEQVVESKQALVENHQRV
jgi:endonuclease/exonuclease/phosphatase family metal-dependent hydrolase